MAKMRGGRPKKYTKKTLEDAIEAYFRSISCVVPVVGADGEQVINADGEGVVKVQYAVPPSVVSMCLYLGIDKRTWANYCDAKKHPEFAEVTSRAMMRHEAYLVEQSILREKGVHGILFNLENNYGYRQKAEVELGEATRGVMGAESVSLREKMALIAAAGKAIGEVQVDEGE